MPRNIRNWTYPNVVGFLKEHDFKLLRQPSSAHQGWIKRGMGDEPDKRVDVAFTHGSYPPKTMQNMIRQSGIDRREWIKWVES